MGADCPLIAPNLCSTSPWPSFPVLTAFTLHLIPHISVLSTLGDQPSAPLSLSEICLSLRPSWHQTFSSSLTATPFYSSPSSHCLCVSGSNAQLSHPSALQRFLYKESWIFVTHTLLNSSKNRSFCGLAGASHMLGTQKELDVHLTTRYRVGEQQTLQQSTDVGPQKPRVLTFLPAVWPLKRERLSCCHRFHWNCLCARTTLSTAHTMSSIVLTAALWGKCRLLSIWRSALHFARW